uniref:Uncharacterized protein n=1 Tax=Sphenodon punctatus TaxID=8508 RepID=A0A8D0HF42_SPHPU
MAEGLLGSLEDDLSCSICLDYFTDPVVLSCEHNFCRGCITYLWTGQAEGFPCPQCRKRSLQANLRPNVQLARVAQRAKELALQQGGRGAQHAAGVCRSHGEALKLFCQEDQALICVGCNGSQEHRQHTVLPLQEAAQKCKEQLLQYLATLKGKRDDREALAINQRRKMQSLLKRVEAEEQRAAGMFRRLRKMVQERERDILEGLAKVTRDVARLQQGAPQATEEGLIAEVERRCQQTEAELLKGAGSFLSRCKKVAIPKWAPAPTAELEARIAHFSRKSRALWEDAAEIRELLILDPSSAHPGLVVSADQRSARRRGRAPARCRDPRRFFPSFCVVGSEGFTAGRHRWEVEVQGVDGWALGVAGESVERRRPMELCPERGVWAVELGRHRLFSPSPSKVSSKDLPSGRSSRIRVSLDYEGGRVTFSDTRDSTSLFTFRAVFTEKLYPFFWLWSPEACITLCP